MSFIKNNNKYLAYTEDEPPPKKIMSEANILIKDLATKQLSKNINFQECLKQEKSFEKLSEHVSLTSHCSGTLSLEDFEKAVEQLKYIEDLKSCNLSDDDVKLILDYKDGKIHKKYSNIEPNILQSRIQKILDLIKEYQQKSQKQCINKKHITHKQNEALALKPESVETKLLKFALENKNESFEKIPHPMDNIKCIENDLFSHLYEKELNPSKVQKQIRKFANRIGAKTLTENIETSNNKLLKKSKECFVNNSKWDKKIAESVSNTFTNCETKMYSCKPQVFYTIRNGQIVKLNSNNLKRNIDIQKIGRLTVEQIKTLPKFENYNLGLPSNVLYLKNLPKCIKESDLDDVFREFTLNNKLLIKVMTGKMRGQAFLTFPNVETASEALEKLNGILLNQKPLVIQFGKKPSCMEK